MIISNTAMRLYTEGFIHLIIIIIFYFFFFFFFFNDPIHPLPFENWFLKNYSMIYSMKFITETEKQFFAIHATVWTGKIIA